MPISTIVDNVVSSSMVLVLVFVPVLFLFLEPEFLVRAEVRLLFLEVFLPLRLRIMGSLIFLKRGNLNPFFMRVIISWRQESILNAANRVCV